MGKEKGRSYTREDLQAFAEKAMQKGSMSGDIIRAYREGGFSPQLGKKLSEEFQFIRDLMRKNEIKSGISRDSAYYALKKLRKKEKRTIG